MYINVILEGHGSLEGGIFHSLVRHVRDCSLEGGIHL